MNKIRESEAPFNKINIAHDLTKKQKEELQEKNKEAHDTEQNDQLGEWMYHVRGPPWNWDVMGCIKGKEKKTNRCCDMGQSVRRIHLHASKL